MFEQKAQHPLVHAERRVRGRHTGFMEGAQTRQGQLEIGPVVLQAHEYLEVSFQQAAGLRNLVFLRAKEESVNMYGGRDNKHVADHDIETFAARVSVTIAKESGQTRRMDFTAVGVLTAERHGGMTVSGQKLVKE